MTKTSHRYPVIGGDDPVTSSLWEDVHAVMALAHPEKLPLPMDTSHTA